MLHGITWYSQAQKGLLYAIVCKGYAYPIKISYISMKQTVGVYKVKSVRNERNGAQNGLFFIRNFLEFSDSKLSGSGRGGPTLRGCKFLIL